MNKLLICLSILFIFGCSESSGVHVNENLRNKTGLNITRAIEMQHLTKIKYKDKKFILNGNLELSQDYIKLQAFGDFSIALFKVWLKENVFGGEIQFEQLKDKNFKPFHVAKDLWRIYLANTNDDIISIRKFNNEMLDQKVKLIFNKNNYLIRKEFYDSKSNLFYIVKYLNYTNFDGIIQAKNIQAISKKYLYQLDIVTLDCNYKKE